MSPLRDAVRSLLTGHRGDDGALWTRLAGEIGAAGLAIPERYGGAGAGLAEVQVVLPSGSARRIFEITTLDRVLPVAPSRDEGLAALGAD